MIGVGGAGSLLIQRLAHLGVGQLLVIDPERVSISNLSRSVSSNGHDKRAWLTASSRSAWVRRYGDRTSTPKVESARSGSPVPRTPGPVIDSIFGDLADEAWRRS